MKNHHKNSILHIIYNSNITHMEVSSIFEEHEWCIIEQGFSQERHQIAESMFSIGNGHMGQRANFEELYSGKTLQGNYIGGVFYPDKTRVGWWKNGYPDYFAKVLNAPSWIGIHVMVNGEALDLAKVQVRSFERILNMQEGTLSRTCNLVLQNGIEIEVRSTRFVSMVDTEIGAIEYSIQAVSNNCTIQIDSTIQSDVHNEDSNYNECFWNHISQLADTQGSVAIDCTKKTIYNVPQFSVATAMKHEMRINDTIISGSSTTKCENACIFETFSCTLQKHDVLILYKYAAQVSSLNYQNDELQQTALERINYAHTKGFAKLLAAHKQAWAVKWNMCDIVITGDKKAQQGIRFNIFQLLQTYTGADSRLNIGPKGFTGEKYGGSTYWDTEAFCLPFYLATCPEQVAKQLLVYRHKQLPQAIRNAEKLGFTGGAALYPMVTMTGDECHNEWEITFEEIHRNGAIAYAIYNYVNYTGDKAYLVEYGLEVLIAISRFWAQRASISPSKQKYVILGVTGPNEYENNINNNWYTNYFAQWCLQYTLDTISWIKRVAKEEFDELSTRISLDENFEVVRWSDIAKNIYFPHDEHYNLILQQDGYLDKEQKKAADIPTHERPINQHWSWDRILRSCYIKQADVVQGLYVFEKDFDTETIRRNFDFYEARCVHESSLSPCIHSVVASRIGNKDKAYELYLRTARLDLDDYNKEAHEGLHITSMAGTWLAIVQGFAGMRTLTHTLSFAPQIPQQWKSYSFKITYRNSLLSISINTKTITIVLESGTLNNIEVYDTNYEIKQDRPIEISYVEDFRKL